MLKSVLKGFAAFVVIALAFVIYRGVDEINPLQDREEKKEELLAELPEFEEAATQPVTDVNQASLSLSNFEIPPGEAPRVRVFDEKGNARIIFQATQWDPISDDTFEMNEPNCRLLLPGGQLVYVRADHGQVKLQRASGRSFNPRSGWLRGNVRLIIDRTTPEWRESHHELRSPEQHPETVVKIWLDDVNFDLDLGRLNGGGQVIAQSAIGRIEGEGLTLHWDESDRQIRLLRIDRGRKARIYGAGLAQFGLTAGTVTPGEDEETPKNDEAPLASVENRPPEPQAGEEEASTGLAFIDEGDGEPELEDDRVDTYRVVFEGDVEATQRDGMQVAGRLKADVLSILRDFGERERSAVAHVSDDEKKPATQTAEAADPEADDALPGEWSSSFAQGHHESYVDLHWTGPLTIEPETENTPGPTVEGEDWVERLHVVATGNPVELYDRTKGSGTCLKLEYHDETGQVWLTGSTDQRVSMNAGENRRLEARQLFLDPREGIARVEGACRMISRGAGSLGDNKQAWPECMTAGIRPKNRNRAPEGTSPDEVVIASKVLVEITFARIAGEVDPSTGRAPMKEYIERAFFKGDVTLEDPSFAMSADQVEATFLPPDPQADQDDETAEGEVISPDAVVADRVLATGNVRMSQLTDGIRNAVACDRLIVEMTVDDMGNNVPRLGRAYGNVIAAQGERSIRAKEELILEMASLPQPVTEEERAFLEQGKQACGYTDDSPEWATIQAKLDERRELHVTGMSARGQVVVLDPEENLNLVAESMDCTFDAGRQIKRALIEGREDARAYVDVGDFYIEGQTIRLDLDAQVVDVPGKGTLRFVTVKDLDGRPLDEPRPVSVTWQRDMKLDGKTNRGIFRDRIRASSQQAVMECRDELRIRFEDLPQPEIPAAASSPGFFRKMAQRVVSFGAEEEDATVRVSQGFRKRPAYLHAVGDAVILSSSYEELPAGRETGVVSEMLTELVSTTLGVPRPRGEVAEHQGRLLSRGRISGPQIAIDFKDAYLSVEGAGNLLLEDYRLPKSRRARQASSQGASELFADASMGDLGSTGMSQTLFRWENSMTYLNQRNVAVFDRAVEMKHRAGSEMALSGQLQQAMQLGDAAMANIKSRRAGMTCENLLVEFEEGDGVVRREEGTPLSRATRLKLLRASRQVRMEESNRSLEGHLVTYDASTGEVKVVGTSQQPARVAETDTRSGSMKLWRGEALIVDVNTNVIRLEQSRVIAPVP